MLCCAPVLCAVVLGAGLLEAWLMEEMQRQVLLEDMLQVLFPSFLLAFLRVSTEEVFATCLCLRGLQKCLYRRGLHLRRLHYLLLLLCLLLLLWGCCGLGLRRFYYASYPPPLPPPPPASRPWDPQLCLAFPNVGPALDAGVVP